MLVNKRQADRRGVGYPGFVPVTNCGIQSLLRCTIEDASSGGARLVFRSTRDVPDRFGLRFFADRAIGKTLPGYVAAW